MRIHEAIFRVDELNKNTFKTGDKILWLSQLDGMVHQQILVPHGEKKEFEGYSPEGTDESTVLLVPEPYSDMYLLWLESKMHYYSGEYERYNNAAAEFAAAYQSYADSVNRETPSPSGQFK